ncbi:hypothetical protein STEG23_002011, partial [Scotinomys teguina]
MWYVYTMEYYAVEKNNDIMKFAGKWIELENVILSEGKGGTFDTTTKSYKSRAVSVVLFSTMTANLKRTYIHVSFGFKKKICVYRLNHRSSFCQTYAMSEVLNIAWKLHIPKLLGYQCWYHSPGSSGTYQDEWKKANVAIGVSLAIWLLIFLVTIPLYVMKQTIYIPALNITTCHDVLPEEVLVGDMFNYFLSLAIGVFLFPALLTASAYVLMIRTLRSSAMDEHSEKKRRRAIRLIVTVLAMYFICFTPSNLLLVVHYFLIKSRGQSHVYALYLVALCLSTLNSCIDPFVYYFVSQDFRDHAKNALLCRSVRTVNRMQ